MKNSLKVRTLGIVLASALAVCTAAVRQSADVTFAADAEYKAQLKADGFPDSYVERLAALHDSYPNWQFEAVDTGLVWTTVIEKESKSGWNLVSKSADDARKSTAAGDYDWYTNTWTIYDGSSWVGAASDYIAYCMDPRNFLDEVNIFQFERLSYNASQTKAGVKSIIRGTFMDIPVNDSDGTELDYAKAFVAIGKETGVSPYHLASRVRQEQGIGGTSSLISGTYGGYEGYYNYFNVGASGITQKLVIENGLAYAKKAGWNTRYKALLGGAQLLAKNYIAVGQDTLYFQKFNVVNQKNLYAHQYMSNVSAAITEGKKLGEGYTDKQQAFVFGIPLYTDMPERACAFTATGNPNNYLKSLAVEGHSLTPSFDGAVTNYSLVLDAGEEWIHVSADAVVQTSQVTGTGVIPVKSGENTIEITCTSGSGSGRTYRLTVVRTGPPPVGITSDRCTIGSKFITGLTPGEKAADFLAGLQVSNATVRLLHTDGSENTGIVTTGSRLEVCDSTGAVFATYKIVLYGDVNGDGEINVLDMITVNRHVLGLKSISGCFLEAADANRAKDGVNVLDMIAINRQILGLSEIAQN